MNKEIIKFGDIEIRTHKFHHYTSPIFLEDEKLITWVFLVKRVLNILSVAKMMIKMLTHYA